MTTIRLLLIAFLSIYLNTSFAQKPEITAAKAAMVLGERPCYELKFSSDDQKTLDNLWEDFIKDQFHSKLKSVKGKEQMAESCRNKSISSAEFNLYSVVESSGKEQILRIWVDLGGGFLSPEYDRAASGSFKESLSDFYFVVLRYEADAQVKEQENQLKSAERILFKLQQESENLENDIKNYEAKISKAKESLEKNGQEQQSAKAELENQKALLNEAQKNRDKIVK